MCTSGAPQPDVHANSGSDGVVVVAVGVVVVGHMPHVNGQKDANCSNEPIVLVECEHMLLSVQPPAT